MSKKIISASRPITLEKSYKYVSVLPLSVEQILYVKRAHGEIPDEINNSVRLTPASILGHDAHEYVWTWFETTIE